MAKIVFALGVVVSLALLAIAVTAGPEANGVEARAASMRGREARAAGPAAGCRMHEVALDKGYGVSRKILQQVCPVDE